MNALYMQQYMQQLQMMNKIMAATTQKTPSQLQKLNKLSFGIDSILSESFGAKAETSVGSASDGSTSSSPSPSPKPIDQTTAAADLLATQLLAAQALASQQQAQYQAVTSGAIHGAKLPKKSKSTSNTNNRARTIFSDSQLERLEEQFRNNQYLVGEERVKLAQELGLNVKQVKIWFQNRRIKLRRSNPNSQPMTSTHPSKSQSPAPTAPFAALNNSDSSDTESNKEIDV